MAETNGKKPEVDPARALSASNATSGPKPPADGAKARPKLEPLEGVTAKKIKTPLSTKFRQAFTGDNAQGIGDWLLFELVVPALKDILFNVIQGGTSRALYGSGATSRTQHRGSNINYNQISRTGQQGSAIALPPGSPRDRNVFNFEGIVFPTRAGAERALTVMIETIEEYGIFAVSDLYDLVNINGNWADDKWGWTNLNGADIVPVRDGFILDLPAVQPIR